MVEYHGWITIRDSPSEGDEERTASFAGSLEERINRLRAEHRIIGMRVVNANHMIWLAGCTNHWSTDIDEVFDLLGEIAAKAPGSYGLLYVWNDECDQSNAFRVWRLARGRVTEHEDSLLTPCIPTIEDEDG